ncbi:dimethylglycine dehydrogenase, mitochondrial, partial [Trichonephila inaurata madagascariensis]
RTTRSKGSRRLLLYAHRTRGTSGGTLRRKAQNESLEKLARRSTERIRKELFQPDLDRLSSHLDAAMSLVPELREVDLHTVVNGPIMYTPDLLPLLGPYYDLPNMWMAVGFGYGIIHSGGAGKYLADWIMKGEPPFDLIEADPNRFGKWATKQYVFDKAAETYGMNNTYTYPKSNLTGWEQPMWFSKHPDAHQSEYQPNLTPFAKFDVTGPDSATFLDKMLANKLPKKGKTNISHLLTPSGKVYAEITVTRLTDDHFFLITGSGSEIHDLRWLKDHARSWNCRVDFQNLTDDMACLSIAGPNSRKVLAKLTKEDVTNSAFPFLSAKTMEVADIPVRALRLSYTGELGWELYHPAKHTDALYKALLDAGTEFEIGDFGTYALNTLRLEKGFRMWGAEMNMDSNPLEAGLDYFIRMDKQDFIGKAALEKVLQEGLSRKLVYLKVHSKNADPDGNESIWCCNKVRTFC